MGKFKEFTDGFKQGQKEFGESIAVIVNSVLLSMVYILGIGITSIIAKISGKRFLDLKFEDKKTYWEDLNLGKKETKYYYKQF